MRLPVLIIASAGNGYQVLYKSKAFDALNPRDFDAVCNRMDGYRFDGDHSFFVTHSLGKMVIGKATLLSKPEFGDIKVKVTHCYFMNMNSFVDIVRGYRKQGAVIGTFRKHLRQDYDKSVEEVSFVKKFLPENTMTEQDVVDTIISLGMVDKNKKFMFSEIDPEDALKVLFGYFPATFISDLSVLSHGEPSTNDINILFGNMNVISDNRIISIHAAAKGISSISDEITSFVMSNNKDRIVELMEHIDRLENGYLAELVSVTRVVTTLEASGVISASNIIKLMDKATSVENKMSIYGILVDIKNSIEDSKITNVETIEKYWAFVLFTSIVNGDRKNAALVNNVCTCLKGINRERYLGYVKDAIALKANEVNDENLALLVLLAHEKPVDKTRVFNNKFDVRRARAFLSNRLNLGARKNNVEEIMVNMILS